MLPRERPYFTMVPPWRLLGNLNRLYAEMGWMWDFQQEPYREPYART